MEVNICLISASGNSYESIFNNHIIFLIMVRKNIRTQSKKLRAEVFIHQGKMEEAKSLYERICQIDKSDSEAWQKLAVINKRLRHFEEAEQCCRQALRFGPSRSDVFHTFGMVLEAQGKLDEAMTAYRKVLQLKPDAVEAYNNLGNIFAHRNRPLEAEDCYRHVLRLKPDSVEAYNNLGQTLKAVGRSEEAEKFFRKAMQLLPGSANANSNLLLCLNYIPAYKPKSLFLEHKLWAKQHTAHTSVFCKYCNTPDTERRLRIGYVSPDLHKHPVAYFVDPILENHDANRVEVICYTDVSRPDSITQRFQSMADGWRTTCGMSDTQVANIVREDAVDILVDLAGHTANNRLMVFAKKPAPIQVTYLGYPGTTGLSNIDYCMTDMIADPPGANEYYTEELVYLKNGFSCYRPPDDAPAIKPLPSRDNGIITFGSLNMLGKVNKDVIKVWCKILRACPASRMLIFRDELSGIVKDQFYSAFLAQGIEKNRVELLSKLPPKKSYLDVYEKIDIALDTFPWNGHTTSCEALWMGIPVITLSGETHAGRLCASVLNQLGLSYLVARVPDDYVKIAIDLTDKTEKLEKLRSNLRNTMASSRLCDGKTFTRILEQSYRYMWSKWCLRNKQDLLQ